MYKLLIALSILTVGCNNNPVSSHEIFDFEVTMKNYELSNDDYYHIQLDDVNQTLEKLIVNTYRSDIQKISWSASDTYELEINGIMYEVDLVNSASYTDNGIAYTMLGLYPDMVGDTISISAFYIDYENGSQEYEDIIEIILE